jgi:hydroxyacylglutathione hydrolase
MFKITAIPALKDNYIWAIHNASHAVVVDPGEAAPVLTFLQHNKLQLEAILCTHRHHDHIDGIAELCEVYNVPVYGRSHPRNPHITFNLSEGDRLQLPALEVEFQIWEVPGHLEDHIAFVSPAAVFCGDVMFGAGCGRNFEGTPAQLQHSLERLAGLPETTLVYCAHEYTALNLPFAAHCEPHNSQIQQRIADTRRLRMSNQATVPFTLGLEKATNPFLRCKQPELIATLQTNGFDTPNELAVFTALREWRDQF